MTYTPSKPIPYARQSISDQEIKAVTEVLKGDWLTQGPMIEKVEAQIAEICNAKHALLVSNCTAALHLSFLALELKKGSAFITSPISFVASSNAGLYCDLIPKFCDVEPETILLNPAKLRVMLESDRNIKAIVSVHFAGYPCYLEEIYALAKEFNVAVIEDAAHAFAGTWTNHSGKKFKIGNGQLSDLTVFSFHPAKQFTMGEGGAILTNNSVLFKKLEKLRTHGITRDPSLWAQNDGGWYYEMQSLGYNYRITDIQAALGHEQLKRTEEFRTKRRTLMQRYDAVFADKKFIALQKRPAFFEDLSYHLYVVRVQNRDRLYVFLRERKIYCQVHYIPIHLQPYYKKNFAFKKGDFPEAEKYYAEALSLPLYPDLSFAEQDYVIENILEFFS